MGQSAAERQRKWRAKVKHTEEYKRKERERKQKSYIPHHMLTPEELMLKREKDRLQQRKNRKLSKCTQEASVDILNDYIIDTVANISEEHGMTVPGKLLLIDCWKFCYCIHFCCRKKE